MIQICLNIILLDNIENILKILESYKTIYTFVNHCIILFNTKNKNYINLIKNFINNTINVDIEVYEININEINILDYYSNKSDYTWIIDNNDLLIGNIDFPEIINADIYSLKYKDNIKNRIFKNNLNLNIQYNNSELIENFDKEAIKYEILNGDYYIQKLDNYYPEYIINKIINNRFLKENKKINITCSIITFNGISKFMETINSFINCCKDIEMIDKWICTFENFSNADIEFLQEKYSFIEFIFKKENGLDLSVKMLKNYINSPYILYIDNDWLFNKKTNFITPALKILEADNYSYIENNIIKDKKIAQVLFTKNCINSSEYLVKEHLIETNTLSDKNYKIKFIVNEYNHLNSNNINLPNFYFAPSMFKSNLLKLINIENTEFFEQIFSFEYSLKNFISCFYDNNITFIGSKYINNTNIINHNDYVFIPNKDSFGNDIFHVPSKNIKEYIEIANNLEDCACFNTYGYFKNKFDLTLINLPNKYNEPDGIYVKKKYLLEFHENLIIKI